jgi:hypothetical protein
MWWSLKGRYRRYNHRRSIGYTVDHCGYMLLEEGLYQCMVGKGI